MESLTDNAPAETAPRQPALVTLCENDIDLLRFDGERDRRPGFSVLREIQNAGGLDAVRNTLLDLAYTDCDGVEWHTACPLNVRSALYESVCALNDTVPLLVTREAHFTADGERAPSAPPIGENEHANPAPGVDVLIDRLTLSLGSLKISGFSIRAGQTEAQSGVNFGASDWDADTDKATVLDWRRRRVAAREPLGHANKAANWAIAAIEGSQRVRTAANLILDELACLDEATGRKDRHRHAKGIFDAACTAAELEREARPDHAAPTLAPAVANALLLANAIQLEGDVVISDAHETVLVGPLSGVEIIRRLSSGGGVRWSIPEESDEPSVFIGTRKARAQDRSEIAIRDTWRLDSRRLGRELKAAGVMRDHARKGEVAKAGFRLGELVESVLGPYGPQILGALTAIAPKPRRGPRP